MSSAFNLIGPDQPAANQSRKQYHRPHELEGKFKSKMDFIKYFKEAVSALPILISGARAF